MDIEPLLKLLAAITPLIQAIAWPVLFLYLVFHFNDDIKESLKNLSKFSIKAGATGIEASGERSIESAAFIGAAIAKRTFSSEPISDESAISGIAKKISDATVTKDISNASVLWVDDSPSNNVLEIKSLKALGIKFTISTSTNDALNKINSNKYDLIITDMKRPDDDLAGYTLLKEKIKSGNKTPLIIYTGYSTPEQRADAQRRGATDCIYDPQELFELVLKIIPNKN